jgi:hypothetical protein
MSLCSLLFTVGACLVVPAAAHASVENDDHTCGKDIGECDEGRECSVWGYCHEQHPRRGHGESCGLDQGDDAWFYECADGLVCHFATEGASNGTCVTPSEGACSALECHDA